MSGGRESTSEPIRVFICYRRVDGKTAAQWLHDHLQGRSIELSWSDGSKELRKLEVYLDTATPAVSNWKKYHHPALEQSRAMLLVVSPGLRTRLNKDDFVHQELDWWLGHRKQAPILIDPTGEGERWLPDSVRRKWPDAQRIELDLESWQALDNAHRSDMETLLANRIIGGIRESEAATTFEDLVRVRGLARRLRFFLALSLVLLVVAGWMWRQAVRQGGLAEARRLAAEAEFTLGTRSDGLIPSGRLALDSLREAETAEGQRISQKVLGLLPLMIGKKQFEAEFRHAAIASTGELVVATDSEVICFDAKHSARIASKDITLVQALAVQKTKEGLLVALARKAELAEPAKPGVPPVFKQNAVVLWNVTSGDLKHIGNDLDEAACVSFSPDGKHLAYSGWRSAEGAPSTEVIARILALENGAEWQLGLRREQVEAMAFNTNESLVTGGRSLRLWYWKDKPKRGMEAPDYIEYELKPDFTSLMGSSIRGLSARGEIIAVLSNDTNLWRFIRRPPRLRYPGESDWMIDYVTTLPVHADSLAFNSDSLATTVDGRTARVWRVPLDSDISGSPRELARMPHATTVLAANVQSTELQNIRTVTTDGIAMWSHSLIKEKSQNDGTQNSKEVLIGELSGRLQAIDPDFTVSKTQSREEGIEGRGK
jgi:hypothetical protein